MYQYLYNRFECALTIARAECNCTPWNYPHPPGTYDKHNYKSILNNKIKQYLGPITDLCDFIGSTCFTESLRDTMDTSNVTRLCPACVADCNRLSFEVSSSHVPLDKGFSTYAYFFGYDA